MLAYYDARVHDFLYLYCKCCYSLIIYSSSASYRRFAGAGLVPALK